MVQVGVHIFAILIHSIGVVFLSLQQIKLAQIPGRYVN